MSKYTIEALDHGRTVRVHAWESDSTAATYAASASTIRVADESHFAVQRALPALQNQLDAGSRRAETNVSGLRDAV